MSLTYLLKVSSGEIHIPRSQISGGENRHVGLESKSFHQDKVKKKMTLGSQSFSGRSSRVAEMRDPSARFAFEFDRMDQNKDGWLSPSELHSALLSCGWEQDQVCRLFDLIDVDNDGRITKTEFISYRSKIAAPFDQPASSRKSKIRSVEDTKDQNSHMLSFEFDRIDKNKDGFLSPSELHQGLLSSGWDQDEVCKLFDVIDVNRDGRISKAEFIAFKTNPWTR
jgi:Ca2+-binding EF-hand superfamily protein